MNRDETVIVLATCAAYDRRTVGEADVTAWHEALADLDADDARQAVKDHYRDKREWLMPVDVRAGVKRIRAERLGNRTIVAEVANPDDAHAYLAALRSEVRRIAGGDEPERSQLELTDEQAKANQERLEQMLAPAFRRPPRVSQ